MTTSKSIGVLEHSALSSMNYLFLKTVDGFINNVYVSNELQNFLAVLNNQKQMLQNKEFIELVETELFEGDYFNKLNYDINQIKKALNQTIVLIMGVDDNYKNIIQFYVDIMKRINREVE